MYVRMYIHVHTYISTYYSWLLFTYCWCTLFASCIYYLLQKIDQVRHSLSLLGVRLEHADDLCNPWHTSYRDKVHTHTHWDRDLAQSGTKTTLFYLTSKCEEGWELPTSVSYDFVHNGLCLLVQLLSFPPLDLDVTTDWCGQHYLHCQMTIPPATAKECDNIITLILSINEILQRVQLTLRRLHFPHYQPQHSASLTVSAHSPRPMAPSEWRVQTYRVKNHYNSDSRVACSY